MYTLILNSENIAISKGINYTDVLSDIEIEITEEQFNSIETPCSLTIVDGKVIAWEKVTLPTLPPAVNEPSFEERLKATEDAINNILGL